MTSTDPLTHQAQSRPKSGRAMMRMTIAVAVLIVIVTTMLRIFFDRAIDAAVARTPPNASH